MINAYISIYGFSFLSVVFEYMIIVQSRMIQCLFIYFFLSR